MSNKKKFFIIFLFILLDSFLLVGYLVIRDKTNLTNLKKEVNEIEKLDYDLDEDIVKDYNIGNTLPVLILEEKNKETKRLIGEKSYEEIKEFLK